MILVNFRIFANTREFKEANINCQETDANFLILIEILFRHDFFKWQPTIQYKCKIVNQMFSFFPDFWWEFKNKLHKYCIT